MAIHFFQEDVAFNLKNKRSHKEWIKAVASDYGVTLAELNYIFCSDEYLLRINKEYLAHDFYTDIITFDQSDSINEIAGDIYISVDRVRENASNSHTQFEEELRRVIIHGILHLLGFGDKTKNEKEEMRIKEDACLSLYQTS